MILILKPGTPENEVAILRSKFESSGIIIQEIQGENTRMIGFAGDTSRITEDEVLVHPCVEKIMRVSEPYKLVNKKFHPTASIFDIMGRKIGGGNFAVIAGPCSVESEEQILSIAEDVKQAGANFLRGGAFKPRTSPYAFKGLELDGLALLEQARKQTGLPIVTEIMSSDYLEIFAEKVDIIQVGARNMQNFTLLRQIGELKKPVLLKRGLSSTIEELLMSAEYIMSGGTTQVILCERGIRTFETATRNTLDLSAIPVLHEKSHLPVVIDPSHASGYASLVAPLSLAAAACGADGLIIEVHNNPKLALCDGAQSIEPDLFADLMKKIDRVREAVK